MSDKQPPTVDEILSERGERYGTFLGHAKLTQTYKSLTRMAMTTRGTELDDDQREALDMIFHKIARIINGDPNYVDSWVDIAGYAQLVADRLNGKAR